MDGVGSFTQQFNLSASFLKTSATSSLCKPDNKFDTSKFREAFVMIDALGVHAIQAMYELCIKKIDKKINEKEIAKTLNRMSIYDFVDITSLGDFVTWFTGLSDYSIEKVLHSVLDVRNKVEVILAQFKTRETRQRVVEVSRSNIVIGSDCYRMEARAGDISLRNIYDDNDVVNLMSCVRFLNNCKDKLRGLNLSNLDLSELEDLSYLDLRGTNFSCSNLSRINFSGSNLSSAKMQNAVMYQATFFMANLQGVDARCANFVEADMRGAMCREGKFQGTKFVRALLGRADFSFSSMGRASLSYADASWTNFHGANMIATFFNSTYLGGANFTNAEMTWAIMTNANISRTILYGAVLTNAYLKDVKAVGIRYDHTTVFKDTVFSADLS